LYLSVDRPDAMFAAKTLMQNVGAPTVLMEARLQRLARYYATGEDLVWCFELQGDPDCIRADGDGDWAALTEMLRKSTSGGVIRIGRHLLEAYSVTQAVNALSSGESEFYAMSSVMARGLLLKYFFEEIGQKLRLEVGTDSTACRGMALRHGSGRVRHLDNKYLWVQEILRRKLAVLVKVPTSDMVADMLTKYTEREVTRRHCAALNLRFVEAGLLGALLVTGSDAVNMKATQREHGEGMTVFVGVSLGQWQLLMLVIVVLFILMILLFRCGRAGDAAVGTAGEGGRKTSAADSSAPREEQSSYARKGLTLRHRVGSSPAAGGPAPDRDDGPAAASTAPGRSDGPAAASTAPGRSDSPAAASTAPEGRQPATGKRSMVRAILSTHTVVELKECCRVHRLPVGGRKDELVDRLVATDKLLTEVQAVEFEELRMKYYSKGLSWPRPALRAVSSPAAAEDTLREMKIACRTGE